MLVSLGFYVLVGGSFFKQNNVFHTLEPINVAIHIISLMSWPQTIRPNSGFNSQISSALISRENNGIPKKEQM